MFKSKVPLFFDKNDLYINFKNIDNVILVTGITGSGKSTLASKLSLDLNYEKISLDLVFGYESLKITKFEEKVLMEFSKKYPDWNIELFSIEDDNVFRYYLNLFYDFIINSYSNYNVIIEGYYFVNYIDYSKIRFRKMIIKRTGFFKSIFRRTRRQIKDFGYNKTKKEKLKLNYLKRILSLIKYSFVHSIYWYLNMNNFLKKVLDNVDE